LNFYKHHIGDYAAATEHLTWDEDQAYTRLLRVYYRDEKPIPADLAKACRLVRATTKDQREAVKVVLQEFFFLEDDGWHNKRADQELAAASAQSSINRAIAQKREATKRERTVDESFTDAGRSREPIQTPDSRHQTPDWRLRSSSPGVLTPSRSVGRMETANRPVPRARDPGLTPVDKLVAKLTGGAS
jgi:uncharacterized protein YdaU (DUF1376 family)